MRYVFIIFVLLSFSAKAQKDKTDRITYFNSFVEINTDGSLTVTENITVYNGDSEAGNTIKHGIKRTFPTRYVGDYKLFYNTTFSLKDVKLDGEAVKWSLDKSHLNGSLVKIGNPGYLLPEGYHTYTIIYETNHQLKSFEAFDELAWNVTGNGWNLRIDSADCTIKLPTGANVVSNACYTGEQNSTAQACNYITKTTNDTTFIAFKTATSLQEYEGLTVATSWNKGLITPPSAIAKAGWLIMDNKAIFILPLTTILIALYGFLVWRKVGKDPEKGNIIPEFYPPADISPAAMGYLSAKKWNNKFMSATIVDLAVNNYLKIDVDKEGIIFKSNVYKILPSDKPPRKPGYYNFADEAESLMGITISNGKYNPILGSMVSKTEKRLNDEYEISNKKDLTGYFKLNDAYTAPVVLVSIVAFMFALIMAIGNSKENAWQLAYVLGGLIPFIAVQTFFNRVITTYTVEGRKLLDKIESFKMYLKTADEPRINAMNPPEKTIDLYEKYMPFAIALDCEVEWGEQFKQIIDEATAKAQVSKSQFSLNRYSSSFASGLSGSIASASTPPSKSGSSSSGGGSSGSGGGGGGGGGW